MLPLFIASPAFFELFWIETRHCSEMEQPVVPAMANRLNDKSNPPGTNRD